MVVAQQPGTSTTPQTQETWHQFNPLSNSWSVPGSGYANYRITPNNELQISAFIAAPGTGQNNVTIATFPSGYRPVSTHGFAVACDAVLASPTTSPMMTITSGGVLKSQGIGNNANVYFEVRIPLDV